jgi:hypothetical protein
VAELVNARDDGPARTAIREELLQMQDDLLYTEKTHFAAAEHFRRIHRTLGIVTTVMSTAAAATIVADLGEAPAGILALLAAILTAVMTFMAPEKSAEQHLGAGRQLGSLRVRLRQVIHLDLPALPVGELRQVVKDLTTEKVAIDGASPGTVAKHFNAARSTIKAGIFDRDRPDGSPRAAEIDEGGGESSSR